jgi:hypothetical protein
MDETLTLYQNHGLGLLYTKFEINDTSSKGPCGRKGADMDAGLKLGKERPFPGGWKACTPYLQLGIDLCSLVADRLTGPRRAAESRMSTKYWSTAPGKHPKAAFKLLKVYYL